MADFAIIGGDLRFRYLYDLLKGRNYSVNTFGLFDNDAIELADAADSANTVILPVPLSKDGKTLNAPYSKRTLDLNRLMKKIKGKTILAGAINKSALFIAENNGVDIIDYAADEYFALKNAVLTAEGAISLAIDKSPYSIFGSNCLIFGYGRIGKIIARYLYSLGAGVCIAARKTADRITAETSRYTSENIYGIKDAAKYKFIFNTVPHAVVTDELISRLSKDCIIIDIASTPGGVDFESAKSNGITAYHALSLPSIYSPSTAAEIIMESVFISLSKN